MIPITEAEIEKHLTAGIALLRQRIALATRAAAMYRELGDETNIRLMRRDITVASCCLVELAHLEEEPKKAMMVLYDFLSELSSSTLTS